MVYKAFNDIFKSRMKTKALISICGDLAEFERGKGMVSKKKKNEYEKLDEEVKKEIEELLEYFKIEV